MELVCCSFLGGERNKKKGFKIYDPLTSHKVLLIYISEKEQLWSKDYLN